MKYLLTSGTGFIGHVLSRQLIAAGHEVTTIARKPERAQMSVELAVEVMRGDITDKGSMRDAMRGVDGVFHDAAWYQIGARGKERLEAEKINVTGTRNVLELMQEMKIPRGVYTSSLAVFSDTKGKMVTEKYRHRGSHLSEYDRTKYMAHYDVALPMMEKGLPLVIVQPGVVYGPGDTSGLHRAFVKYLKKRLPWLPSKTTCCWSHVEDTAQAHILAMEKGKPGETYIIAGHKHTVVEVFKLAEKITGIPAPRLHLNPMVMQIMAVFMEILGYVSPLPQAYSGEGLREAAGTTYIANDEKARSELGFDPRPLEVGLRETLAHEQNMLKLAK